MLQTIVYSLGFFLLFFFSWDVDLNLLPNIRETWVWNSEGRFGTTSPKIGEDPLKTINGYKTGGKYYSFRTGKFLETDPKYLVDFPLLSNGYLLYEKIGDEVNFFSDASELFWKKPINSYPRSGYFASPVLYLAGDNNTVFLMDESGNRVGKSELNGRFLTDYQFDSKNKGVIVLFSGGEIYRLDEKGNVLFESDLSKEKKDSFFKSVSLSPDGKFSSVHYSLLDKDFVLVLDEKGETVEEFSLPKFYPHKLYFVTGNDGSIIFNLPDSITFYQDGKLSWEKTKQKSGGVYQSVFATDSIYVVLSESEIQFYNTKGNLIRTKRISPSELPIRFFPGKVSSVFYMQSKSDLMQFQIF
ncbi:hypothetical protein EHQ16_14585 [Leptospira kanakyensis]|uniref:WD40 repeat domain-containing protein n=1 Tax=Leptospira kanakyensis TaxID=2484968 RepID=A0A6N4Q1H5_9LEPT|nr:hypothetical protein [Leptospira kanakyensis]TGK51986.1 hypothetical protein EHQ11_07790 [Leptospira kanakyensis]TGK57106.1 hypothetical protein EHQ16_14585 [Leptospira kanakyensis]TGK71878.1 hypothetical protein EHQ18_07890 [Leptospira kanakyensis]